MQTVPPEPPAQIGRYQIVGRLGFGGMATVYDGFDASVNRYAAVKLLHRQFAAWPEIVDTFLQEARKVARLERHDGILTVYEVGEHEGIPYIAMQKIDGVPLDALLARRQGVLPCASVRQIFATIGGALGFAHAHGIVHCDIKPSNILVERLGRAFLTDFGISRARPDRLGVAADEIPACTPRYASPEQLRGQTADARSDIYSLGLVLYEMCTGVTPFADCEDVGELCVAMTEDVPCAPSRLNGHVSASLDGAILKALAPQPDDRYQNVVDFIKDVLTATDDEELSGSNDWVHWPRNRPAWRYRWTVTGVGLVAVASLTALALARSRAASLPPAIGSAAERTVLPGAPDRAPAPRATPTNPQRFWLTVALEWLDAAWDRAVAAARRADPVRGDLGRPGRGTVVPERDFESAVREAWQRLLLDWAHRDSASSAPLAPPEDGPTPPVGIRGRSSVPAPAPPPDFGEIQRRARALQEAARRGHKR